jgi:hypothetical protein
MTALQLVTGNRDWAEVVPKKSRDYNDYDHYAYDVEDIHRFALIETTIALSSATGGF